MQYKPAKKHKSIIAHVNGMIMHPNWNESYIAVNEKNLHPYARWRQTGSGTLHGFSDYGMCWLQTAQDSYDIIMPEARGHGLSAGVQSGEHVGMVADRMRELNLRCNVAHIPGTGHHIRLGNYE